MLHMMRHEARAKCTVRMLLSPPNLVDEIGTGNSQAPYMCLGAVPRKLSFRRYLCGPVALRSQTEVFVCACPS